MKTWTNPSVEELEVKNTAYFYAWWQVEEANGKLDDSLLWGTEGENGTNPGTNPGTNTGNDQGFGNDS